MGKRRVKRMGKGKGKERRMVKSSVSNIMSVLRMRKQTVIRKRKRNFSS